MAAGMVLAARSAFALDPIGDACVVSVAQSSDLNVTLYPASNALDGRTSTFTHTQNLTNRFLFRATPPFALDLGAATGQGALLSFPSVTGGDYVIEPRDPH
jgi:hypothetical protein